MKCRFTARDVGEFLAPTGLPRLKEADEETMAAAEVKEMTNAMRARSNMLKGCMLESDQSQSGQRFS